MQLGIETACTRSNKPLKRIRPESEWSSFTFFTPIDCLITPQIPLCLAIIKKSDVGAFLLINLIKIPAANAKWKFSRQVLKRWYRVEQKSVENIMNDLYHQNFFIAP
jgi:hypothetical protein